MRRVLDGVDPDKVELALVGLGERLERLDLRLEVLGLGVGKEVGERQTGLGVVHKVLGAELVDERDGLRLEEVVDLLLRERLGVELHLGLVKLAVDDKGGRRDTGLLGDGGVVDHAKQVVVAQVVGDGRDGGEVLVVRGVEEGDGDDAVLGLELRKAVGGDGGECGERLLLHVRDDAVSLAVAVVVRGAAGAEDLEGGEALDAVLGAQLVLLGAVDLGELDAVGDELGGRLFVLGSERLAVTAPGRKELDEHQGLEAQVANNHRQQLFHAEPCVRITGDLPLARQWK